MRKLVGVLLLGLSAALTSVTALAESTKAINFQFTDIDGKTLQLSDFKGKWVLVNFWAPWCPLCWVEVPTLNELNKRKDFVVIGVGLDYGPDENVVRDSAKSHSLNFHSIVAGGSRRNQDSPFRQVGPVDFYPTSYIYDPNGEIVMFIPGQVRLNKVLAFMDSYKIKSSQTQIVDVKQTDAAPITSPVQEVTYSKQSATADAPSDAMNQAVTRGRTPTKPAVRRSSSTRTVTY